MNNTVLKTYDILKLVSRHKEGLTLSQIMAALSLPKSTAFNLVKTLESVGMLRHSDHAVTRYLLGLESLKIGLSFLSGSSLDAVARPILSKLCHDTKETTCLSVRSGPSDLVYVMQFLSDAEYQSKYSIGDVRSFLSLAMGKAMLSVMDEEEVRSVITPDMFSDCSVRSITDMDSLLGYLRLARRRGYAVDETAENVRFATPVAAPVLDANNQLAAAISLVVMQEPGVKERIEVMGKKVHKAALDISRGLGFMGRDLYDC
ncbi:MAG: IclR family transcriptional regulator [Ruminococcaceae bacterium]|nr:IclR family transcriptional regulator [Oscillospiraceae bacterium]